MGRPGLQEVSCLRGILNARLNAAYGHRPSVPFPWPMHGQMFILNLGLLRLTACLGSVGFAVLLCAAARSDLEGIGAHKLPPVVVICHLLVLPSPSSSRLPPSSRLSSRLPSPFPPVPITAFKEFTSPQWGSWYRTAWDVSHTM